MRKTSCIWLILAVTFVALDALADQAFDVAHAKYNFQMFCQGCHTAQGRGNKSVPNLNNSMGVFLKSQVGREYLVRVPGSANSALSDADLTELLNWMLQEFSGDSLPSDWQKYQIAEISEYRKNPLFETVEHRKKLLKSLSAN